VHAILGFLTVSSLGIGGLFLGLSMISNGLEGL